MYFDADTGHLDVMLTCHRPKDKEHSMSMAEVRTGYQSIDIFKSFIGIYPLYKYLGLFYLIDSDRKLEVIDPSSVESSWPMAGQEQNRFNALPAIPNYLFNEPIHGFSFHFGTILERMCYGNGPESIIPKKVKNLYITLMKEITHQDNPMAPVAIDILRKMR